MMRTWLFFWLTIGCASVPAAEVDYRRDVKPLLAHKCTSCHGVLQQEAGLRLDAGQLIAQGGDGGPVIVPGQPAESLLIDKVSATDPVDRMPPQGEGEALDHKQIAVLTAWIRAGAPFPKDELVVADPHQHWAFQQPVRPPVPAVGDPRWMHPVDAFLEAERRAQGLVAVEPADDNTLLRRVYFDLIGLPPSRAELHARLAGNQPIPWLDVVDALLKSPHYGERWGRHWMDIWRYSDWDGYKNRLRGSQRHIWRWRDWIIQSLNADKGYDRMILEMLAGDELAPGDPEILPATGFLARNYHHSNRNIWLDATVEHTAKAFLGLTLNCARCHDHKYDPLVQQDYYRFRAIFEPHRVRTDLVPGEMDPLKDGLPRAYDADLEATTYVFQAGNEKHPDKDNPVQPGIPDFLGGALEIRPIDLPLVAYYPMLTEQVTQHQLGSAHAELERAAEELAKALAGQKPAQPEGVSQSAQDPQVDLLRRKHAVAQLRLASLRARQAADLAKYAAQPEGSTAQLAADAAEAEREYRAERAAAAVIEARLALQDALLDAESMTTDKLKAAQQTVIDKLKEKLAAAEKRSQSARKSLRKTDQKYTPLGTAYPRTSSGRRLALAQWIANDQNPLTARVAVNHIWLRHFGQPLVSNVFDFGLRSPPPTHAALLDWLAVEFIEHDWSMKHLHRLIVTSRTWQLDSTGANSRFAPRNQKLDPENQYYWRANVRRLDAELVRDRILAAAGKLDRTIGGPDINHREGETTRRRSIYIQHAYEKQMTMLVLFDAASPTECYRRSESIIPQQALALSNSSLSLGHSRNLASQLSSEVADSTPHGDRRFIELAFLQLLSRRPQASEMRVCLGFLNSQTSVLAEPERLSTFVGGEPPSVEASPDAHQRARENLVHVLLNHNDFVAIR